MYDAEIIDAQIENVSVINEQIRIINQSIRRAENLNETYVLASLSIEVCAKLSNCTELLNKNNIKK